MNGEWFLILWLGSMMSDDHPIANGPYKSLEDCQAVVEVIDDVERFECAQVQGFTLKPIVSDIDSVLSCIDGCDE